MFTFSNKPKGALKKNGSTEDVSSNIGIELASSTPSDDTGSVASSTSGIRLPDTDTAFQDIVGKTMFKEPGELNGIHFRIRNCQDSVLVLFDYTGGVTIEECNNCIIICGPCRGSIFVRNCTNCLLMAACQQFRVHNSRNIEAHLHCSTKPSIEETDLIVAPLLMSYNGMEVDMASAGLDRSVNRWQDVQNFTPDLGEFRRMPFDPFANGAIGSEVVSDELLEQLSTFMEEPDSRELVLGPS